MDDGIDRDRRRFLGRVAMTMTVTQVGAFGRLRAEGASARDAEALAQARAKAQDRVPRELAAIERATEWINTPPLTAASLLSKVVVVDFCTYTCIN
jgi:hypothetical protein